MLRAAVVVADLKEQTTFGFGYRPWMEGSQKMVMTCQDSLAALKVRPPSGVGRTVNRGDADGKQFSFGVALPCGAHVVSSDNVSSPHCSCHVCDNVDVVVVVVGVVVHPHWGSHSFPFVVDLLPSFLASYRNVDTVPSHMVTYPVAYPYHDMDPGEAFVAWPSFARGTSGIVRTPPCSLVSPWGVVDTYPYCNPCGASASHPIHHMHSVVGTLMEGSVPCGHFELHPY